jgi:hypothetical protein
MLTLLQGTCACGQSDCNVRFREKQASHMGGVHFDHPDPGTKTKGEDTNTLFRYNFDKYPKKLEEISTLRALEAGHHWQGQKGGGKLGKQRAHVPFTYEHEADSYSLTFDTTASVLASTNGILVIEFHNRMTGSGVCGKSPPVSFEEVNNFIRSLGLNPRSVIMQTEADYISPGTEKQPGLNRHFMIGAWTANMLTLLQGTCACGQSDCKVRFREKQASHMGGVHFDHPDPGTKTRGQKTATLFRYNFNKYPHKLEEIRTLRALEAGHHWLGQKGGGKLGKQRVHVPFTYEHEAG